MKTTIIPNLVIAQRVVDKIARAASLYVEDETGEAMIGLVAPGVGTESQPSVPTVYILETIAPDDSAVRQAHTFQQGDELQDEMLWWFYQNWNVQRDKNREQKKDTKWDLPLQHLGDWHRQPGHMIAPSGADLHTALDMLGDAESDFDFLLAPIVTLGHPPTTAIGNDVNYLTVPQDDGSYLRIDFWYIDLKARAFLPIMPTVYLNEQVPELVAYPWHLIHAERFRTEMSQFRGERLFTSVMSWDVDGKTPLEICFMLGRQGADTVFILVTDYDYPNTAPRAYTAPFMTLQENEVMYDMMKRMWPRAYRVDDPPGWKWNKETYLVDYVCALEDHLGLRPPSPEPPADEQGQDAETIDESENATTEEKRDVG